jgi:hypothetical protein
MNEIEIVKMLIALGMTLTCDPPSADGTMQFCVLKDPQQQAVMISCIPMAAFDFERKCTILGMSNAQVPVFRAPPKGKAKRDKR